MLLIYYGVYFVTLLAFYWLLAHRSNSPYRLYSYLDRFVFTMLLAAPLAIYFGFLSGFYCIIEGRFCSSFN